MEGNGVWEGEGEGKQYAKGIVKQTAEGDDISRAVALELQKEMYVADPDMER